MKSKVTLAAEDIECPITQLVKPLLTLLLRGTLNGYEWKVLSTPSILERSQIALKNNSEENLLYYIPNTGISENYLEKLWRLLWYWPYILQT